MGRQFQRTKEDFTCQHCGAKVTGDGYTNHCPDCLWSRHVDEQPGDRAAECGGLMRPVAVGGPAEAYRILHRCEACGRERWNRAAGADDFEALLALARQQSGPDAV